MAACGWGWRGGSNWTKLLSILVNKECCLPSSHQQLPPSHLNMVCPEGEFRMAKKKIPTLDAYLRNNFNEPRFLHLLYIQKCYNH